MSLDEFEARIAQILEETGTELARQAGSLVVFDATARSSQFDALEKELRDAANKSGAPSEAVEILNMFLAMRTSLTDPDFLKVRVLH